MFRSKRVFAFSFFLLLWSSSFSQSNRPIYYSSFEKGENQGIDTVTYKCSYNLIGRSHGKAVDMGDKDCLLVTNVLKKNISSEFSIEFLFNGSNFFFLTFSEQMLLLKFGYSSIHFRTTSILINGKKQLNDLIIDLNGAGKKSYNYYADDKWHHFVFTASTKSNKMEIWVDGECPDGFSTIIPTASKFDFGSNDGFRNTDKIDELGFYKNELSPSFIRHRYFETLTEDGGHSNKRASERSGVLNNTNIGSSALNVDPKEFAPGYPNYSIQAMDQLKSFPLPRYNFEINTKRNMSWMDISYLHRQLPMPGGLGFGQIDPSNAVAISDEMAENWNYYMDVPILRTTADLAAKVYSDTNSLHGALVNYANKKTHLPISSVLMQVQVKPMHAGFDSQVPYVTSQNLPAQYYFREQTGKPVLFNGKKWLSPLMPLDIVEKDARTSRFYLDQLLKFLHSPPTLVNENGEIFGHILPESLLQTDSEVWLDYKKSGLSLSQYSGRFQFRMDSVYRYIVIEGLDKEKTHFSFYNLSAFNPSFWPDYKMRRTLNVWDKKTVFSTPDFYPRWPYNWQNARGAFNGYGTVSRGRAAEISLGDLLFSPFVSAGWDEEESNIRPAQWLALLKAMMMLGADFFYVGYFNITGPGGKWSNGVGPNDPRGYAYQIAMPAYAQAIKTWIPDFFERGELMNPADSQDLVHQFRFKTKNENELVLIRKLGKKYLIYGSLQPNSNIKGNVPNHKNTTINLEGKPITFEIRRQGSMYIFDQTSSKAVFYQLDKWHQYEHPYYWSKSYVVEPETLIPFDRTGIKVMTDAADSTIAFIEIASGQSFKIPLSLRQSGQYSLEMNLKLPNTAILRLSVGNTKKQIELKKSHWNKLKMRTTIDILNDKYLVLEVTKGNIDVDNIKLVLIEK